MQNKRNFSLELIRVTAMFMIIADHILMKVSFPMQAMVVQIANSGVFMFLLISGLLYGNKHIDDWKSWFLKRLMRICIPLWIFMVFDFIVEAVLWNTFEIKYVFIYAFNLQGILGVNIGGTNLWFLTLIMICYIITPLLQWIKQKDFSRNIVSLTLVIAIPVQIILAYTTNIGMVAGHTLSWCVIALGMYALGYFAGNKILCENINKKRLCIVTILAVISSITVIMFNIKFDGQVIYDRIIIFYGMVILDLWICMVIYKMGQYVKEGWIQRIINHLDSISYEFYIVHGLIISAVTLNVLNKYGAAIYILSTIVLSYLAAVVFHLICKRVYNVV